MSFHQPALTRCRDGRDLLVVLGSISVTLLVFAAIEIVIAIAIGATLAEALVWATLSIIL
jgi:hypothetical protein